MHSTKRFDQLRKDGDRPAVELPSGLGSPLCRISPSALGAPHTALAPPRLDKTMSL